MQPAADPPRDSLTAGQVTALIRDSASLTVGYGAELLDLGLAVLDDITGDLAGGSVSRASYANLHGTASLSISRDLDWGRAIIRPYMTLSDGTTTARFNLGAYFTNTPTRALGETPVTYDVECYDILSALDDVVGDAYAVVAGATYLTAIETILIGRGITGYVIDQTAAATVLPTDRTWVFDDKTTWLTIINDLAGSIGYQGIWSDWTGQIRVQPYATPLARAPEWVYDIGTSSMLSLKRTESRDYHDAPNRWVFYRSNQTDGPPPTEGDGIYTYVNATIGDTSVEARGRTITRAPIGLDVADQASLLARAQSSIDADMQIPTKLAVATAPNPLHWHFDRLYLIDPDVGPPADLLSTQWTLPLNGDDMSHEWTVLG